MKYLLKLLEFQKELKLLLDKYKIELEGTHLGDGNMYLYFNGMSYIMKDDLNILQEKCNMYDDNWYYDDIRKDIFLSQFPKKLNTNHQSSRYLICTNNRTKVLNFMNTFDGFERKIVSKENIEFITDGINYKWIKLIENSRGNRCGGLIMDLDLLTENNKEIIDCVLLPTCIFCTKDTVKFI